MTPLMLEILLIRHGQTDWNRDRRIMGRRPIPLNAAGRQEAMAVAAYLSDVSIDAVFASPVRRAAETASLIVRGKKVRVQPAPEMAEIEYGRWVGKTFQEVTSDKNYQIYHTRPGHAQAPGGEKMTAVHKRAVGFIELLRLKHKSGRIVVVSHADVIKAVLVHYLGLDLNDILRFRIDNGSLSLLWFNRTPTQNARVMAINSLPSPGKLFLQTDQLPSP